MKSRGGRTFQSAEHRTRKSDHRTKINIKGNRKEGNQRVQSVKPQEALKVSTFVVTRRAGNGQGEWRRGQSLES